MRVKENAVAVMCEMGCYNDRYNWNSFLNVSLWLVLVIFPLVVVEVFGGWGNEAVDVFSTLSKK